FGTGGFGGGGRGQGGDGGDVLRRLVEWRNGCTRSTTRNRHGNGDRLGYDRRGRRCRAGGGLDRADLAGEFDQAHRGDHTQPVDEQGQFPRQVTASTRTCDHGGVSPRRPRTRVWRNAR